MSEVAPAANPELGKRIQQYLNLRDAIAEKKKAQAEELKKYTEAMEKLEARLFELLNASGGDSLAVRGVGTVYRATQDSATVGDKEAFRDYIMQSGNLDMMSLTANKVAVREFIEQNGRPPPGVNFTQRMTLNVRRD